MGDFWCSSNKRHLVNALKYSTSFPVIYISYLIAGSTSLNVPWLLALIVNFALSSYWDLVVDWDLGHWRASPKTLLRPEIHFKKSFYCYAIAINLAIRGLWMLKIYFIVTHQTSYVGVLDSNAGFLVLQVLELVRRFIWLVFRSEVQFIAFQAKSPIISHNHYIPINE